MTVPRARHVAGIALLAAVYVAAGRLGLWISAVSGFASPVWGPTGISLATLVLFGRRYWPGVALGALLVNLWTGASPGIALGIAAGNTLEAVLGAYALHRVRGFDPGLGRLKDVFALIFAALVSTIASASIGVSSLFLGGVAAGTDLIEAWRVWWVGDVVGDLVVAPLVMTAPGLRGAIRDTRRLWEGLLLVVLVIVLGMIVFSLDPSSPIFVVVKPVSFFPLLMWAALRFGPGGAAAATFLASTMAIWGTASGAGVFAQEALADRLVVLQGFMANMGVTALILAAVTTARSRAEFALREAHDDLEVRVHQRTAELSAVVRDLTAETEERQKVAEKLHQRESELRKALLAREEMIGVVAHDLRNPIAAAHHSVTSIKHSLAADGPTSVVEQAAVAAERALARAVRLIGDLLEVTRVESGTLVIERRPVAARDLVVEVAEALATVASDNGVELRTAVEGDLPCVLADKGRLFQVFTNLVDNGTKFTPEGGRISIGARRQDGEVCFSVTDSGVGIPAEDIPYVFDRFWQARRGDRRGAGLGLAIAKGLVDAHDGRIWVQSSSGHGSTFYFTIPVAPAIDPE